MNVTTEFIYAQMIVFLFYGLAFLLLGTSILLQSKKGSHFNIAKPLWLLAGFGIFHGLQEWSDMFLLYREINWSQADVKVLGIVSFLTGSISFVFLLQFGLRGLNKPKLNQLSSVLLIASVVFIGSVVLHGFSTNLSKEWFFNSNVFVRYFLGFPGAFLTALAFLSQKQRPEIQEINAPKVLQDFSKIAVCFFLYSILAGLVVPQASFLPASFLNDSKFFEVFGIPIQVFRMICAIGAMYYIIRIM